MDLQEGVQQQIGSTSALVQVVSVAWRQLRRGRGEGGHINPQVMWAQVGMREEGSSSTKRLGVIQ